MAKLKVLLWLLLGLGWTRATQHNENVYMDCSNNEMKLTLVTTYPFYGRMYVPSSASSCQIEGVGAKHTHLTLPIHSPDCGVFKQDEESYVAIVAIQHHPLVQQFGDRALRLVCNLGVTNYTVTSALSNILDPSPRRGEVVDSTSPSPHIHLRILNVDGSDVTDARLGQKLILRVEMDENSIFNLAPKGLIASSGRSAEHLELLDEDGCPTENGIFPSLESLPNSNVLQGSFRAFKFSDDVVVRFHMNVQFCVSDCPTINCNLLTKEAKKMKRNVWPIGSEPGLRDPFLPLQKEIIVDGAVDAAGHGPYPLAYNMDEELVCVTKTVFIVVVVVLVIVQICLLVTSVVCIWVARKYKSEDTDSLHSDNVPCIEPQTGDTIFYAQGSGTRL